MHEDNAIKVGDWVTASGDTRPGLVRSINNGIAEVARGTDTEWALAEKLQTVQPPASSPCSRHPKS